MVWQIFSNPFDIPIIWTGDYRSTPHSLSDRVNCSIRPTFLHSLLGLQFMPVTVLMELQEVMEQFGSENNDERRVVR